jgi:hypothetical protein
MLYVHRMSKICPGVQVCCEIRQGEITPATEPPPSDSAELPSSDSAEPPPPGSCGIRGSSLNPTRLRIFSEDNVTEFGEFPWMLALLRSEETYDGDMQYDLFQCGASLIHPQVALTAAHCVNRYLVNFCTFISSFSLALGHLNEQI